MFRAGSFVASALDPVAEDAVQPNGVDLTVEAVHEQVGAGRIATDGKTVGERARVDPESRDGEEVYALSPGSYVVEYGERIAVPEGHVGFVLPRSSLLRNSCMLNTAVWDAGYEGRGEGLLQVTHRLDVDRGARIGQFVLAEADHEECYDGSYQGERLDE